MRNAMIVGLAVLLGACAGNTILQPVNVAAPAAGTTAVTMECVTRELDNMGYEVATAATAPNQVTGIRINEKPWFLRWFRSNTADQITARVENGQLRVMAYSSDPNDLDDNTTPETTASEVATQNARSILDTCAM